MSDNETTPKESLSDTDSISSELKEQELETDYALNIEDDDSDGESEIDDVDEDEDVDEDKETDVATTDKEKNKKVIKSDADILIQKFMEGNEELNDGEVSIDSDSSDDEYVKFDDDVRTNHILNHHNELIQSNFDEIKALTKVVRDNDGNIVDPLHKTIPILTKFERARILGLRSKQLSSGADPFVKIPHNIIQSHAIAEIELEKNVLPFIITRPLPNGKKEYWKLQDLEQIDY
ncbi:MAG: hypothetical protein CMF62_00030 [Magnetococcales bacterium]|nr:hypothetical protein [Magnetococcales bacterium]|tara:strand:+ start:1621 stop:2322 length:702 start_codon:yes stop_codon:yes gene_type:complete